MKITKQKKQTRIKTRSEEYASNRQCILSAGMSEEEYNNLWLDTGYAFLCRQFKPNGKLFQIAHSDNFYWRWWLLQFRQEEQVIVECFKVLNQEVVINFYKQQMEGMVICSMLEKKFENYLKNRPKWADQ